MPSKDMNNIGSHLFVLLHFFVPLGLKRKKKIWVPEDSDEEPEQSRASSSG